MKPMRALLGDDRGYGLIELMLAVAVLGLAMAGTV
jgi:prepilin-type N-terminal cleavage/methylation domain-containing protein